MSDTVLPTTTEETLADRLVSVDIDEWSPAGGPVHIDLSPRSTVLVGKNASGKSIALEGIASSAVCAVHLQIIPSGPGRLRLALSLSGEPASYFYHWAYEKVDDDDDAVRWEERCWSTKTNQEIWRVINGVAYTADDEQFPMPPGTGLLGLRGTSSFSFPSEAERVRRLLSGIRLVRAGIPRTRPIRTPVRLRRNQERLSPQSRVRYDERVYQIAARLIFWFEDRRELFDHFVALARRLGIARHVDVKIEPTATLEGADAVSSWASILFDGIDFGFLSDGTLRLAEILLGLVDPKVSVLMLEEPETGLHPGLLHRLLAEVHAHSLSRQIVLSTHSPQVVDWAKPSEIRLVERLEGKTTVRSLGAEEKESVKRYLSDDFGLSDYIYSSEAAQ